MSASSFLGGVEPARRVLGGLNTSVGQVEERDVRGHCFPPVMTAALRHLLKFIRSFCLRFRVSSRLKMASVLGRQQARQARGYRDGRRLAWFIGESGRAGCCIASNSKRRAFFGIHKSGET